MQIPPPPSARDCRNVGHSGRRVRRAGMVACLHAAALFAANDAARAAMESRSDERSSRAEEKAAGTTPELRKAVAALLVAAARRVNAVNEIAPSEAASAAIGKVAALVEEYKLVAAQAKHRKGDTPDPEPEPAPEPTPEPNGDSPVS